MSLSAIPFHVFASLLNPFFRAFHILFFSWNDQHLLFWFPAWNLRSVHTLLSVTCPFSLHLLDMMLWTSLNNVHHDVTFEFIWIHLSFQIVHVFHGISSFRDATSCFWAQRRARCSEAARRAARRRCASATGKNEWHKSRPISRFTIYNIYNWQKTCNVPKTATCMSIRGLLKFNRWYMHLFMYIQEEYTGQIQTLERFRRGTPQPKEQTLDSPRERMWGGVLRAWAEGNCSHAGSTRNYQFKQFTWALKDCQTECKFHSKDLHRWTVNPYSNCLSKHLQILNKACLAVCPGHGNCRCNLCSFCGMSFCLRGRMIKYDKAHKWKSFQTKLKQKLKLI